jgi:manganese-dependent inorganic pyrophosphatase
LQRIDYPRLGNNQWELVGVVSRKKQLLPYLLGCLSGFSSSLVGHS